MKKTTLLLCFLAATYFASSQTPITINSSDIPIPKKAFNYDDLSTKNPTSPVINTNANWDLSTLFGNDSFTTNYITEQDTFFTNAGIDVNIRNSKAFNPSYVYYVYNGYDFNANAVEEKGMYIPRQAYSVSAVSGNQNDSLTIPEQKVILSNPRVYMKFPFTMGSNWGSVSRRVTNFNLTVTAYGLNNAPAQHIYTFHRTDTIIGWGKMRTYTANGPSPYYEVLMEKVNQYAIDSFLLNGQPAPVQLLGAFSVSQGQKTNEQNLYNFYRKGSFSYYARYSYGDDNTYTNLMNAYVNTDTPAVISGIANQPVSEYSTIVYPNPSNGNEVTVQIMGKNIDIREYTITNMLGQIVQNEKTENNGATGQIRVSFNANIANGQYILTLKDKQSNIVVNERVYLAR